MKPNIHPHYRTVVFHDTSANEFFKVGSTTHYVARNSATRIARSLNERGGCTLSAKAIPALRPYRAARKDVNGSSPAFVTAGRRR